MQGGARAKENAYTLELEFGLPSHVGISRQGADDATTNGFGIHLCLLSFPSYEPSDRIIS